VADHRVERVRSPVAGGAGDTEQRRPKQRCDDRVARVLGNRFDRGAAELRDVKVGRIATDQCRGERACPLKLAGIDGLGERVGGALKRATAERCPDDQGAKHGASPRTVDERAVDPRDTTCNRPDQRERIERADRAAWLPDVLLERV